MNSNTSGQHTIDVLEHHSLTITQFAQACNVTETWIVQRVQGGVVHPAPAHRAPCRMAPASQSGQGAAPPLRSRLPVTCRRGAFPGMASSAPAASPTWSAPSTPTRSWPP